MCIRDRAYPMTRVTTVQGDATDWIDEANNYYMNVIWPQGQHVGISESTYRLLCEEKGVIPQDIEIDKDEIYIVYQQDVSMKAHPLDWYMDRKTPQIRIGQPLRAYSFTPVSYTHLDVYKRQPLVHLLNYQVHGRVAKPGRDKR